MLESGFRPSSKPRIDALNNFTLKAEEAVGIWGRKGSLENMIMEVPYTRGSLISTGAIWAASAPRVPSSGGKIGELREVRCDMNDCITYWRSETLHSTSTFVICRVLQAPAKCVSDADTLKRLEWKNAHPFHLILRLPSGLPFQFMHELKCRQCIPKDL